MKINGSKTTTEQISIDVSLDSVLNVLKEEYRERHFPKEWKNYDQFYINKKDQWEGWNDDRGSGSRNVIRDATDDEIQAYEFFNKTIQFLSKHL